jgi:poly(hydroxyalkanoate) depolymerase family esterase
MEKHDEDKPITNINRLFMKNLFTGKSLHLKLKASITLLLVLFSAHSFSGSWQQNVTIGGFNNVHIYTPDSLSSIGNGKALLIVLHGCVQPINNYLTAQLESAAENHGMVIAVPDAMNKAGFSCWSYWQGTISRSSGDYKNLIDLANTMSGDSSRNIDVNQVYITGLSSGAAMSAQTACLAPDIFAGVAPSAGPSIGTSSNGAITTCETVSASTFKSRCEGYAGSSKSHFDTQIAVIGHGTADTTVNTCYNQQNADGFAMVYGVTPLSGSSNLSEGSGRTASQTLWADNRVSMLWFDNLDHSWSGGAGASGDYIADDSINFSEYLGQFFADNNQRVDRNSGPEITNLVAIDSANALVITGNAIDEEGTVNSVTLSIHAIDTGSPIFIEELNIMASLTDGSFTESSSVLVDGLYQITAYGTDNENKAGDSISTVKRIGPEPADTAPALSGINVVVAGQCAKLTGNVIDVNQNLSNVTVNFSTGNVTAVVNNNQYSAEQCNLAGGSNSAMVTATDSTMLSSSETIQFTIDAGVSGDYNLHINQGHISWGVGYSSCYLEFGTAAFTMREYPTGTNQCQWIADGAPSCSGANQTCVNTGTVDSDIDNDGVIDSEDNCPNDANVDQADNDNDGIGNICDSTPNGEILDSDSDGIINSEDNCPNDANVDQADNDNDGIGNVCDSTPDPISSCAETTANNYVHVQANRATTNGIYAFAVGSGESLGLYNIFFTSTLAETSDNYFEVGSCP